MKGELIQSSLLFQLLTTLYIPFLMRKAIVLLIALTIASISSVWAVPAKRGFHTFTQSDGTTIRVQTYGDERFHAFVTDDGLMLKRNANGDFCYATLESATSIIAHNRRERTMQEVQFVGRMADSLRFSDATVQVMGANIAARVAQARKASQVPYTGKVRVPVIVVDYPDKKISNTLEAFNAHYNEAAKCARQYFIDQSNGKFEPQFDVYGVYTLSENRAAYGGNTSTGADKGVGKMVGEACDLATEASAINWADYDNDHDGNCDVVIVVYAGVGEAQASTKMADAIWPCQWSLDGASSSGDGDGAKSYSGVKIDKFAVFNELYGSNDSGTTLDGIGTFCHEFSHSLGLPDFYMTTYGGNYGMGTWSLMDYGCYNDSGNTPVGYSAYEKSFLGWIQLETPQPDTEYTLPVFNAKSATTDRALKIENTVNPNEYFVMENRHKQGWDSFIADEGVMVTHVTYVQSRWKANTVNNYTVQLMTIMPADGVASDATEVTDLFGEVNHALTDSTNPATALNLGVATENYPVGNQGFLGKPITDIYLNPDSSATLRYCNASGAELDVEAASIDFGTVFYGEAKSMKIGVKGKNITSPTMLGIVGGDGQFASLSTTLSATEVNGGAETSLTFSPSSFGEANAELLITNEQRPEIRIPLRGNSVVKAYSPALKDVDELSITDSGFRVEWADSTLDDCVKDYTLKLTSEPDPKLVEEADFSALKSQTNTKGELIDCKKKYSQLFPAGWKVLTALYVWDGHVVPGGKVTTPSYSTADAECVSVVIKAQSLDETLYQEASLTVKTGAESKTCKLDSIEKEFVFVLKCKQDCDAITIIPMHLPAISSIKIYGGDITFASESCDSSLQGSALSECQFFTGITDKFYDVKELTPTTKYRFRLLANYRDGTSSPWTEVKSATTALKTTGTFSVGSLLQYAEVGMPIAIPAGKLSCVGVLGDGRTLITKDDNGYLDKDVPDTDEIDFVMRRTSFMRGHAEWDQSNWIAVTLPEALTETEQTDIVGHTLGAVRGTLTDADNASILATAAPTAGDETIYEGNTFIAPNFLGTQMADNPNADGSFTTYFFVRPKPGELARVQWAMWVDADNCFQTPTSVGPSNREGLRGSFYADFSKYEGTAPTPRDGEIYSFEAMITTEYVDGSHSVSRATADSTKETRYVVYPLRSWRLEGAIHGDLVTASVGETAHKQPKCVEYVNAMGVRSSQPFDGINVVVTTYADGTRTIAKICR